MELVSDSVPFGSIYETDCDAGSFFLMALEQLAREVEVLQSNSIVSCVQSHKFSTSPLFVARDDY